MPRTITDEVTALATIRSYHPQAKVEEQLPCQFSTYGTRKQHAIDGVVREKGISLGIEVATLNARSKSFLASHKEDMQNLAFIRDDDSNGINQAMMILNGIGIRHCDFKEMKAMGEELGVRVVKSLADFTRLCKRKQLLAA